MAFFKGRHVTKITVDWTNARGYHAGHGNFTEFLPFLPFNHSLLYEDFSISPLRNKACSPLKN